MLYIRFRKKFILPIKYFFAERKKVKSIEYPDRALVIERLEANKKKMLIAQKRENIREIAEFSARVDELTWILYGSSKD